MFGVIFSSYSDHFLSVIIILMSAVHSPAIQPVMLMSVLSPAVLLSLTVFMLQKPCSYWVIVTTINVHLVSFLNYNLW